MKKIWKILKDIYFNKLNNQEKYYVDVIISYIARFILKLLDIFDWIYKHEKLTTIFILLITLIFFYFLLYILGYFLLGFNFFMEKIGLEEVIEIEKKIYHYI